MSAKHLLRVRGAPGAAGSMGEVLCPSRTALVYYELGCALREIMRQGAQPEWPQGQPDRS